ncbi:restriction endonuclease subunit S [Prevotella sp. KH2C16]|uniref:restriction endonuclease subunit S n=1 Tax=Prevotella sp. KH2C16 TaxID=1855325 RepID=UPI0015A55F5D|nr:restriction endonuclease subunit S [Prevotella sp. KH2C16]
MAADKQDKVLNVPTLRFPEFSGEWNNTRLKDLCKFLSGGTPSIDNVEYWGGDIPFVSAIAMHDTHIEETPLHLTKKGVSNGSKQLKAGNLLLLVRGSMLWNKIPICYNDVDVAFNQDVKGIIPNSNTTSLFLLNWILSHENKIKYMVTGTGIGAGKLDSEDLLALNVKLPSLIEQKKIEKFLSLIDERITTQIRIIEKLKSLMKGLNDYLQDSMPLSYSLSFSDIGEDYSGLSGKAAEDFGRGKPYITYVCIYANNFVDDDCCDKVSIDRGEKQNIVLKGDMLFTLSSETPEEVCYGAVYSGNNTETYLNSFCFGVRNIDGKVFSPYMAYFFNSSRFRREVYPLAQGSTRFNLQKSDFLKKQFSYPSIDDQHRIFEILNAYDNKLKVENQILAHYQHQKEFLLRNLLI